MKSSSGKYFIGLDHIRAFACFMVFTWHFIHINNGQLSEPPIFPFSLLTEGHTGVALFMVLSGYLFSKLLSGKKIIFKEFVWNRFLRLAPLLLVVIIIVTFGRVVKEESVIGYLWEISEGLIKPVLPNGAGQTQWNFTFICYYLYYFLLKTGGIVDFF
ncbi:acyltransferase family protein [Colwellia sp. MSW7]|uniref:Acyltransferase family protein n=1 Tax=Colwellia maritima TaxID=2912588 RepID=A0ABS9WYF0_9GAMM|nr:acyltransferase family protein [Colwellia maritima]MCI2282221.1 acyltransferase family protein [Colwellia maritima]